MQETNIERSKKELSKFQEFKLYIKCFKSMILSHHPKCENFEGHTLNIGKYRLCIGCFVGYPSAIIGIFGILFLNLNNNIETTSFFIFGLLFLSTFLWSPLGLTKIKKIKILQKFLIGIGSSMLFWGIWTLSNPFIIKLLIFLGIFGALLLILNLYHAHGFQDNCIKCEYSHKWDVCPGFREIRKCLEKNDLPFSF